MTGAAGARNTMRDKDLEKIVVPELDALGYECVKLEVVGAGRSPVVRLYIDKPGGVTIRDCAFVNRTLGMILEETDPFPGRYVLEVSSPGNNRPLVTEEHFARFAGKQARVTVRGEDGERTTVVGTIVSCSDGVVTLNTEDHGSFEARIDAIEGARLHHQEYRIDKKKKKEKRVKRRRGGSR